jgi:hypothetical protein
MLGRFLGLRNERHLPVSWQISSPRYFYLLITYALFVFFFWFTAAGAEKIKIL